MNAPEDLIGRTFGRLKVVQLAPPGDDKGRWWTCLCTCGKSLDVRAASLKSGNTKSCGCYRSEKAASRAIVHGKTSPFGRPRRNPKRAIDILTDRIALDDDTEKS